MALGAAASQVRAMILRQGLGPVCGGLAGGLVVAAVCARILGSMLYGVSAWDVRTFAGVTALWPARCQASKKRSNTVCTNWPWRRGSMTS